MTPSIVTIHNDRAFPVQYKRVRKPRIFKRLQFGIWYCGNNEGVFGEGYSPAAAYHAWLRNNFLPERS